MKLIRERQELRVLTISTLLALCATPSDAALTITAVEREEDVVFTGVGSLDVTGWSSYEPYTLSSLSPYGRIMLASGPHNSSLVWFSETSELDRAVSVDVYWEPDDFQGPMGGYGQDYFQEYAGAGSANQTFGFGTGFDNGEQYFSPYLVVPSGYVSGSLLYGAMTFTGQTLESMGLTPGIREWSWGTTAGGSFDSLQLVVVPEPSTFALAGLAAGGLIILRRRRQ